MAASSETPTAEAAKPADATAPPPQPTTAPNISHDTETSRTSSLEVDTSKPKDFNGQVTTNDDIPPPERIREVEEYMVLDKDGKTHTFRSLYNGKNVARRVLVIFIRHFFCGNCQDFLRTLSESITPEALLGLPISTFICVIGCGDPALIDMYVEATGCPFPVYTDPTRKLFESLGMVKTLQLGERPAYTRKSLASSVLSSVMQGLKQVHKGLATKSGDHRQVGGEFLFEPYDLVTPVATPQNDLDRFLALGDKAKKGGKKDGVEGQDGKEDNQYSLEEKRITWCHRMRTTRDHAEIPELVEILGLDGQGEPIKDKKRWDKAIETRKGTGLTMANQMCQISSKE